MASIEQNPVSSNPKILGGTLVFTGTRVQAQSLLDYLNDGFSLKEYLEFFPTVSQEKAEAFLEMVQKKASGRYCSMRIFRNL